MVLEQWNEMTIAEKIQLIGKTNHLLMNDLDTFTAITSMVRSAEASGKLDDVTILNENKIN